MEKNSALRQAIQKIESYCAYQERCHREVIAKLRGMQLDREDIDKIIVHLISNDFLNEGRFATSFARGKHRIKHWGKIRIVNELKLRNISEYNINAALKEIPQVEYDEEFENLAKRHWDGMREQDRLKKRKKFCDFMLRKGYESAVIYQKMKLLEN